MTITGKPVTTLPEAESVTNADYILVFSGGALMRAPGTLFRGDPATINGENVLTIEAGDNIALSQDGGTLTLSASLSGIYRVKGSATLATLPALTAANEGFVYDMSQSFTTTADFKEGAGKEYPAGTNVVVASVGGDAYKYDVLSGFVDLSGYVQKDGAKALSDNNYTTAEKNAVATIGDKVDKVAGKGLSTEDYTTAEKGKLAGIEAGATANAAADAAPPMDGTAAAGTSAAYARGDHRHPTDTSRASAADVAAIKELLQSAILYRTASGNPAAFSDGYAANLRKLSVTLTPAQSGNGAPSPSNVRPISGASSVSVTRAGTGGANSQTVTLALVDSNGGTLTVYGGTLDVLSGALTVTQGALTLDGSNEGMSFSANGGLIVVPPSAFAVCATADSLPRYVSERFVPHIAAATAGFNNEFTIDGYGRLFVRAPSLFTSLAEAQSYFAANPTTFAAPLAAPAAYQLTPAPIAALSGYNSVSASAGTLEIEYRSDPAIALGGG